MWRVNSEDLFSFLVIVILYRILEYILGLSIERKQRILSIVLSSAVIHSLLESGFQLLKMKKSTLGNKLKTFATG